MCQTELLDVKQVIALQTDRVGCTGIWTPLHNSDHSTSQ
jgi:hypothetical protein